MKKLFTLIAIGSVTLVSADQYYGNRSDYNSSCDRGEEYYQGQSDDSNYYQQNDQRQYRQNDGRQYRQRDNRNYQQLQPRQSQNQYYQQSRNQQYQQSGNQSYNNSNNYGTQDASQGATSDMEIGKKIGEAISSGWFSKGFQNVSYDVNRGNVTLRGSVDTIENKNKVEDSVRKIEGVRQVNNQITVSKENNNTNKNAYTDSQLQDSEKKYPMDSAANPQDRQLNARIRDKLSNGWFSKGYETLVIRTSNGFVVISGTVDKNEDIQKVNDHLKNVEGVRSINNQLRVKN